MSGYIIGFMTRDDVTSALAGQLPGTFLVRFRYSRVSILYDHSAYEYLVRVIPVSSELPTLLMKSLHELSIILYNQMVPTLR